MYSDRPALVMIDVELEELNGFEVLSRIRNDVSLSRIPVIMLSYTGDREHIIQSLQNGANSFLALPEDADLIPFKVQNLLEWETQVTSDLQSKENVHRKEKFLASVNSIIEQNLEDLDLNMNRIAEELGISSSGLQKSLKRHVGKSVSQYVREYRLMRSRDLMEAGEASLTEISARSGFRNLSYFSKSFKNFFGVSPSDLS